MHFSWYEWNQMHISNNEYMEGIKLYWGFKKCKRKDINKKKIPIATRKMQSKDPKTNWTQEDVMIKAIKCSNESRWNSPRYMHNEEFVIQYRLRNMESSFLPRLIWTISARVHRRKRKECTLQQTNVEQTKRNETIKDLLKREGWI